MNLLTAIFLPIAAAASLPAADLGGITAPLAHAPTNPLAATFQKAEPASGPAVVTAPNAVTIGERELVDRDGGPQWGRSRRLVLDAEQIPW
jgi:hypothetical protein